MELLRECVALSISDDIYSVTGDCDMLDDGFEDIGTTILSNRGSDLSGTFISLKEKVELVIVMMVHIDLNLNNINIL